MYSVRLWTSPHIAATAFRASSSWQAVWLYFRFPLSYRDVEDMLAERGIDVSYETVRRWALKFGTIIARKLRRGRPRPDGRWHLDEVFVSVNGEHLYVWRAVGSEGEVVDIRHASRPCNLHKSVPIAARVSRPPSLLLAHERKSSSAA